MKAKRGVVLIVILVAVLVVVWLWMLGVFSPKKIAKKSVGEPAVAEVTVEEIRKKAEETASALADWLERQVELGNILVYHRRPRDPFIPPVKEKVLPAQLPKLVLTGIAWDEVRPLAVINDLVVEEGNRIGEVKIVKIYFNRVIVEYSYNKFVINLVEVEEKTK